MGLALDIDWLVRVRRELNHLYVEPYSPRDAGLFCREHALHLQGVAIALGHESEICTGMFGLRIPGLFTNAMTNSDGDHAWCRIDGVVPVDASLTIRRWPLQRNDLDLVFGRDVRGLAGFNLEYRIGGSASDLETALSQSSTDLLLYSEQAVENRDVLSILNDPFSFLRQPPGGAPSMLTLLGPHIFFAITMHCLKLARREAKPLWTYRDQWNALRTIARWYPDAQQQLTDAVGRGRAGAC